MNQIGETEEYEQASWLHVPDAGIIKSLQMRFSGTTIALLEGAYLGFPGDPVMHIKEPCTLKKILGCQNSDSPFHIIEPARPLIVSYNPAVRKISRFISPIDDGTVLRVHNGRSWQHMSHIEAGNEGYIAEKSYFDIFTYIGRTDATKSS